MFRRVEEGIHPEVEMGRILTEQGMARLAPAFVGAIEYRRRRSDPMTLSVLHAYLPHHSDAWQYTLDVASNFFERMAATTLPPPPLPPQPGSLDAELPLPEEIANWIGDYLGHAALLGTRLAELHHFLSQQHDGSDFTPEPFTLVYQRSLYQSLRASALDFLDLLQHQLPTLAEELHPSARQLIASESQLLDFLRPLLDHPFHGQRTRIHADCHLGQILFTGKDFHFIDFEGVPTQSLGERRLKRSPLQDVSGILGSFEDAAQSTLLGLGTGRGHPQGLIRDADRTSLAAWAEFWRFFVARSFLTSYVAHPGIAPLLPTDPADLQNLLRILTLQRWIDEFTHELHRRPRWLAVPLNGLIRLIH
jgi:maltose alpha-D-glucosyltransferase/alpha-amylase